MKRNEGKILGFAVYAGVVHEADCKTRAGARRCADKLRRLGVVPSIATYRTDGAASWLQYEVEA